jgi:protein-S-isoprenylcysteine O-methyltransferase Ste14
MPALRRFFHGEPACRSWSNNHKLQFGGAEHAAASPPRRGWQSSQSRQQYLALRSSSLQALQESRTLLRLHGPFADSDFPEPAPMQVTPSEVVYGSWLLLALYWLVAALGVKRSAKRQNPAERMLYIVFMAAGFFLLYQENPNGGPLNHRFVRDQLWIAWLGSALCAAGVLFALWARRTIGKDWSAEVQIKQGHELIRSGPYAHIRHPIYTGLLLATLGTALLIGEYRGLIAVAIILVGFIRKARKEESFLAAEFGPAFAEHRRHTGFFLPRFC